MKQSLVFFFLAVLLTACSSSFAPVIVAPVDVPLIASPDELPIQVRTELKAKKIGWLGSPVVIATNEVIGWPAAHPVPDSVISLRFSPDGRYYVYISQPLVTDKNGLPMIGDDTVGVIDFETGSNIVLLSRANAFPDAEFFYSATFAPDEQSIIFVVYWENSADLVRVNVGTKQIQRLNVDKRITNFGYPDISVKEQIVIICDKVTNNQPISELCLLDENGKFLRYLTNEGYPWPGYGRFTPDGEWVVYESRYKLYKVRVDGSERQEIAPCALGGPLLVTENYVVTECLISQEPTCQAVFVGRLDGREFWRLGYLEPLCMEAK